jgi:hypothetical protein
VSRQTSRLFLPVIRYFLIRPGQAQSFSDPSEQRE